MNIAVGRWVSGLITRGERIGRFTGTTVPDTIPQDHRKESPQGSGMFELAFLPGVEIPAQHAEQRLQCVVLSVASAHAPTDQLVSFLQKAFGVAKSPLGQLRQRRRPSFLKAVNELLVRCSIRHDPS